MTEESELKQLTKKQKQNKSYYEKNKAKILEKRKNTYVKKDKQTLFDVPRSDPNYNKLYYLWRKQRDSNISNMPGVANDLQSKLVEPIKQSDKINSNIGE